MQKINYPTKNSIGINMQTGIVDLNSTSLPSGSYLIDTNVLLYMYEIIQSKNDPGYNNLLMKLINDSKWKFYVNSHIISEFINRFVRNSYNTYLKENTIIPPDRSYFKKVYRKTEDFNTRVRLKTT